MCVCTPHRHVSPQASVQLAQETLTPLLVLPDPTHTQVVVVSSTAERVNAAVKAIGSAAQGEVVDATKEDQVGSRKQTHRFGLKRSN